MLIIYSEIAHEVADNLYIAHTDSTHRFQHPLHYKYHIMWPATPQTQTTQTQTWVSPWARRGAAPPPASIVLLHVSSQEPANVIGMLDSSEHTLPHTLNFGHELDGVCESSSVIFSRNKEPLSPAKMNQHMHLL